MTMGQNEMTSDTVFRYPDNLENALSLIQEAVSGESEDRAFYTYLAENAPDEEASEIITSIRNNEINHYNLFRKIYSDITGEKLMLSNSEEFVTPDDFCDGLKRAITGEQNAVQKYRQILYAMQPRTHINMLVEILTDEIRHGILYSYLYSKYGCNI
jgi:rubrerythrin